MTETINISAHCDCGALSLYMHAKPIVQLVCHCNDCKEFSGLPYTNGAFFHPDGCRVEGEAQSTVVQGGTGFDKVHYSCASCHAPMYVTVAALNGATAIEASRLSPFTFEAQAHIWTEEKADDVVIPAEITQTTDGPPKEIVDIMVASFWAKN